MVTPVLPSGHLVDIRPAGVGLADCVVGLVEAEVDVCGFFVAAVLVGGGEGVGCYQGGGGEG